MKKPKRVHFKIWEELAFLHIDRASQLKSLYFDQTFANLMQAIKLAKTFKLAYKDFNL